jgi:tRNA(Leu) C34 or U34 (ribose-2'-O)-methylase TrmL
VDGTEKNGIKKSITAKDKSKLTIPIEEYRCLKIIASQSTESFSHGRIGASSLKG